MGRGATVRALVAVGLVVTAGAAERSSAGAPGARFDAASCSQAVAAEAPVNGVRTAMTPLAGNPFGVAVARDGGYSFVSGSRVARFGTGHGYVDVLSDAGLAPKLVRTIGIEALEAGGDVVTPNGRYLLVAAGSGAAVIDVARAETGSAHAQLGLLTSPGTAANGLGPREFGSAIEVTTSPDGRFAFVSLEYQDEVAVFDLAKAFASGFRRSGYVGAITLGQAVVGMAVSPDGRWLYATSEIAAGARPTGRMTPGADGTVSVIDLKLAETRPASSVVSTVPAGCGTVRVEVSPDGQVVWVTARESDDLLAFSASKLVADPRHALLARVRVGEAPVGLAVVDGGAKVVVADSNRFMAPGQTSDLTVVDAAEALAGKPAVVGKIRAGLFPRELALEPNGQTLLVTNFESSELEAVDLTALREIRSSG